MTISYDDVMRGLYGEPPEREITPEEVEELARAYRDEEDRRTKMHIPLGGIFGGGVGGALGLLAGGPKHKLLGGLLGGGVGAGLGGWAGHLRRQHSMGVHEDMGREMGQIAQRGMLSDSTYAPIIQDMKHSSEKIAEEVLRKLASGMGMSLYSPPGTSSGSKTTSSIASVPKLPKPLPKIHPAAAAAGQSPLPDTNQGMSLTASFVAPVGGTLKGNSAVQLGINSAGPPTNPASFAARKSMQSPQTPGGSKPQPPSPNFSS